MSIQEDNKKIAKYMGLIIIPAGTKCMGDIKHPEVSEAFLKYHSSWDWLIPVCKSCFDILKIGQLNVLYNQIVRYLILYDIENTYQAVVEFIKWYNMQGG